MGVTMRDIRRWIAERSTSQRARRSILERRRLRRDVGLRPESRTARWYDFGR